MRGTILINFGSKYYYYYWGFLLKQGRLTCWDFFMITGTLRNRTSNKFEFWPFCSIWYDTFCMMLISIGVAFSYFRTNFEKIIVCFSQKKSLRKSICENEDFWWKLILITLLKQIFARTIANTFAKTKIFAKRNLAKKCARCLFLLFAKMTKITYHFNPRLLGIRSYHCQVQQ
jgi:hypothetical protein